jgi:hypothetical protein
MTLSLAGVGIHVRLVEAKMCTEKHQATWTSGPEHDLTSSAGRPGGSKYPGSTTRREGSGKGCKKQSIPMNLKKRKREKNRSLNEHEK